jgi:hypothetical protein
MARPSEYNFEMCKTICEEVAEGFNIKTILKSKEEYPDFSTWCRWKRENDELRNLYVNAMQDKSESVIEEIDHVYDLLKNKEIEPSTANVLIQTNKWLAGKFYPKMYGDKVDVTSDGEKINQLPPVIQFVDTDKDEIQ